MEFKTIIKDGSLCLERVKGITMEENEFDNKTNESLKEMRKRYPSMNCGDLQTVAMFCNIFKELNLKEM